MITPGSGEIAGQLRINEGRTGSGSGVVWNRQGQIVSNAHVIRGENVEVEFGGGDGVRAKLEVQRGPLPAPVWADSLQLRKGDNVLAVGNPLGFVEHALQPEVPPIPGITIEPVAFQLASRSAFGLRIQQIVPGSEAQVASPLAGDVIIGADGKLFSSPDDLFDRLNKGGLVQLKFHRSGKVVPREVAIPLGPIADGRLSAAA